MPFPDITKVYGRGYTNVRDSIRAYKTPVLSMKTQEQLNKEIASNTASHRIKWSEAEVQRAVLHRIDDETAVVDAESVPEEEEDAEDEDYEEDSEVVPSDVLPRGLVEETPEETVNPVAEAYERFVAAGLSRLDVPKLEGELKAFMKEMRDKGILKIKYGGKSTPESNRSRLMEKLGIPEGGPAFYKWDEEGLGFKIDGGTYKRVEGRDGEFEKVERSKRKD